MIKKMRNHDRNPWLRLVLILILILASQYPNLSAQTSAGEPGPWEPDALTEKPGRAHDSQPDMSLDAEIAVAMIRFYQTDINPNSVSRCPFRVSCSNFAIRAVKRYGFVPGILIFVDRLFYRENMGAFEYYPKIRNSRNQSRLDDTYFLTGELSNE
jgi:putative component of membrane protein insertase Oxa1/YidC/SpoIIIJ protein YidD